MQANNIARVNNRAEEIQKVQPVVTKETKGTAKPKFGSLEIAYLGTRQKERNANAKKNVLFMEAVDGFDRKDNISIPGQVDVVEQGKIFEAGPETIAIYQEARKGIEAKNRKLRIFQVSSAAASLGIGTVLGLLSAAAPIWTLVGLGVTGLNLLLNAIVKKRLRDPHSFKDLAEFAPQLKDLADKIDRGDISRPHWVDEVELEKMPQEMREEYYEVLKQVRKHNRIYKVAKVAVSVLQRVTSNSAQVLRQFFKVPDGIVKAISSGGTFLLGRAEKFLNKKIVPIK